VRIGLADPTGQRRLFRAGLIAGPVGLICLMGAFALAVSLLASDVFLFDEANEFL
jgi:hypothetical protein